MKEPIFVDEIVNDMCLMRLEVGTKVHNELSTILSGKVPISMSRPLDIVCNGSLVDPSVGLINFDLGFELSDVHDRDNLVDKVTSLMVGVCKQLYGGQMISADKFFGLDEESINQAHAFISTALVGDSKTHWVSVDNDNKKVTLNCHSNKDRLDLFRKVDYTALNKRIANSGWRVSLSDWKAGQRDNPHEFKLVLEAVL